MCIINLLKNRNNICPRYTVSVNIERDYLKGQQLLTIGTVPPNIIEQWMPITLCANPGLERNTKKHRLRTIVQCNILNPAGENRQYGAGNLPV